MIRFLLKKEDSKYFTEEYADEIVNAYEDLVNNEIFIGIKESIKNNTDSFDYATLQVEGDDLAMLFTLEKESYKDCLKEFLEEFEEEEIYEKCSEVKNLIDKLDK